MNFLLSERTEQTMVNYDKLPECTPMDFETLTGAATGYS